MARVKKKKFPIWVLCTRGIEEADPDFICGRWWAVKVKDEPTPEEIREIRYAGWCRWCQERWISKYVRGGYQRVAEWLGIDLESEAAERGLVDQEL